MKMQDEIMKRCDSAVVALNNRAYLVYLKRASVRCNKEGKHTTKIKAFVKKL